MPVGIIFRCVHRVFEQLQGLTPPTHGILAPTATVVIPTRNRSTLLPGLMEALANQDMDRARWDVLLVDNASTDDTPSVLRSLAERHPDLALRWTREERRGPAAARNRGIREAKGDILLFTDDDCLPEPGWVRIMLDSFEASPDAVAVEGAIYTELSSLTPLLHVAANSGGLHATGNIAYRTPLLRAIGGFDVETFPMYGEDVELGERARRHGRIVVNPASKVFQPARPASFAERVAAVRGMLPYELCLFLRYPDRLSHGEAPPDGHTRERPPLHGPFRLLTLYPVRGWTLLTRLDLLRERPALYLTNLALVLSRVVYALLLLPWGLRFAWRHRRVPHLPPLEPVSGDADS